MDSGVHGFSLRFFGRALLVLLATQMALSAECEASGRSTYFISDLHMGLGQKGGE